MSTFEIITLNFTFVLGLGIAQILNSIATAIRDRNEHPLHWIPITWALLLFFYHVQFWFGLLMLATAIQTWTWGWYVLMLALAVLLFVAGALVLPGKGARVTGGLHEDFRTHGRLALIPLTIYFIGWILPNAKVSPEGWILDAANVVLAVLVMLAWFPHPRLRAFATVASVIAPMSFFALGIYAGPEVGSNRLE